MLSFSRAGVRGQIAALLCSAASLPIAGPAFAQSTPERAASDEVEEVVVTGSRVDRAGFEAPTPTTVVGDAELRAGNRPNIALVLNDLPQFRTSGTPAQTAGNTNNSVSGADLRSLGAVRTLSLLNGRRFVGASDLNTVPQIIVKRAEIVTGGASAAWGSGAVAGVVNLILDDEFEGGRVGVDFGASSRDDGYRRQIDGAYGLNFAEGRGHAMVAAEYTNDQGIYGRNNGKRPNLDSDIFTTATGQLMFANNVNFLNATLGGVITSGALTGQAFNKDGTLSPAPRGGESNATATIGGTGRSQNDFVPVSSPFERFNAFGRASYDLTDDLKVWTDLSFTRMWDEFLALPEAIRGSTTAGLIIQRDNAFLRPDVRAALASGPQTFRLGRIFGDPGGYQHYKYERETLELAAGADGRIGEGWHYSAFATHGEVTNTQEFYNQRITPNFNNAIDAVFNAQGQIVCRVALTNPTTDCRPLNIFGLANGSPEAIDYAFAGEEDLEHTTRTKLTAAGVTLRGEPFSIWAGPVSVALGGEARKESFATIYLDPIQAARLLGTFNASGLDGSFSVKEVFGEAVVPLLNMDGVAKLDANGAIRYSDYSNSGGITSWKYGATLGLFNQILLRGVYSRDIRSPAINELFTVRTTSTVQVIDPFRRNEAVTIRAFGGGNPNLVPETSHTLALGGSYAPTWAPGFSVSLDYYRIEIEKVIATIAPQNAILSCFAGNSAACGTLTRDASGTLIEQSGTFQNLARYRTEGFDFELLYRFPLERIAADLPGNLRLRALTTYVSRLQINDGFSIDDRVGSLGNVGFGTPRWKATVSALYQVGDYGFDVRARYIHKGVNNKLQNIVNGQFASRIYVDIGAQAKFGDAQLFAGVNNLFDRDPPFVALRTPTYDVVGRYYNAGIRYAF
jgi:outer membrane receptor protein involved in Fe transport